MKDEQQPLDERKDSLSLKQLTLSILAAMFGVQSGKNHRLDAARGKPRQFIIGGIIFVVLFLVVVNLIASLALS